MNVDRELEQWQSEWQKTPATALDIDALIAETRRRNRREKAVAAIELLSGLMVVGACLWIAATFELHVLERVMFVALAFVTGGFSLWALRQRRRNWHHLPMDASALLELERRRLQSRLRYWRVSLWAVTGIWGLTLLAAVLSHFLASDAFDNWQASAAGVLIVLVGTALWSMVVRRQTERRLKKLDALERQ